MKSHSSPANSTPVGPPPTTITLSSLSRSGEDLQCSPEEGPDETQGEGQCFHTLVPRIPRHRVSDFLFFPNESQEYLMHFSGIRLTCQHLQCKGVYDSTAQRLSAVA